MPVLDWRHSDQDDEARVGEVIAYVSVDADDLAEGAAEPRWLWDLHLDEPDDLKTLATGKAASREAARAAAETALPSVLLTEAARHVAEGLKEPAQEAMENVKATAADATEHVKAEGQGAVADVKDRTVEAKDNVQQV